MRKIGCILAAPSSRSARRIIGYGVAGATARFVLNREDSPSHASFELRPAKDGWELAFSLRTP
jgi:hypothetical protein